MHILIQACVAKFRKAFPTIEQSGILVDNELLIDVGEKSFLNYKPKWILISHFHPDHAYFVRHGRQEVPEVNKAPIYAPEIWPGL